MSATPPLSATYLNVQIARVSAALEAAGAWDPTPTAMNVNSLFGSLSLFLTYTRGGVAGAFDFQIQYSPYSIAANVPAGAQEWVTEAIFAAGAVAAGADTTNLVQRDLQSYTATGAAVEMFSYGPIEIDHTVERIRVRARESGNVGAPGTLQLQANFG